MADKLNNLPRTPDNQNGYSLIAVHAWSNSVDSLLYVKSLLDENIRVVAPDDFVYLVKKNICNMNTEMMSFPNPTNGELHIRFNAPIQFKKVVVSDLTGREIRCDYKYNETLNSLYIDLEIDENLRGLFNIHVLGESSQFVEKIFKY